ncbi:hypothetical protein H4P12_12420 [Paracoccus sp. 11-3]|uniref:Uncharacterized protein n=1 Tax=Paracoccus amoyensis TaxID=2760093 RepID=A0A926JD11_9RHOB|nr:MULTISPECIES: hypothetical protein [Paracoccus]MBC9247495.1 hypothetical protein [Paracoccus amoyensis]NHF74872.1 hypothetical protein [Paracoccus xiamenensis]
MTTSIDDANDVKDFLRQRAQETWDERQIPYYLSLVAIDLKQKGVDYRTFTGPLRLAQWLTREDIPDTKLVAHPTVKAKVGLIPAGVDFDFSSEPAADQIHSRSRPSDRRGQELIKFVDSLAAMPETASAELSVPAKVLIALLRS